MDLSKLPRLSDSRREDGADQNAGGQNDGMSPQGMAPLPEAYPAPAAAREPMGASVWISVVVGVILMMMSSSFGGWLIATMLGRKYNLGFEWPQGTHADKVVPYWEVTGHYALSESAIFLFGLAMLLEGAALLGAFLWPRFSKPVVALALLMAMVMTLYNLVVAGVLWNDNTMPTLSMLAVAFGGYMVITEWALLRSA